jgi:hypothetical protein
MTVKLTIEVTFESNAHVLDEMQNAAALLKVIKAVVENVDEYYPGEIQVDHNIVPVEIPSIEWVVTGSSRSRPGDPPVYFQLGTRPTQQEAENLLRSYVMSLINGGGTATYSHAHNEYKVIRKDGGIEYIQVPKQQVAAAGSF